MFLQNQAGIRINDEVREFNPCSYFLKSSKQQSMKQLIVLLFIFSAITAALAQEEQLPERRNTVKLELTASIWYNNAFGFSYERITKPNQSFAISAGYQQLRRNPRFGSNVSTTEDRSKRGFKYGAEYRFYLRKENKHPVPRGVYMGPYFTQHSFDNERILTVEQNGATEEAILKSELTILNVGAQLGYQFVINNRWTIDLVFIGPSISHYRYSAEISGNYTFDPEDIENEVILDFIERFPLLDELISEKEATRSGGLDTWSYGYRYQIHLGYHFGRKK
jgi:hypothetical protein